MTGMNMNKKPWKELPSVWKTEAAFWTWLKGVFRRGWVSHPLKIEFLKRTRIRLTNPKTGKECFGGVCNKCQQQFVQKDLEVNHIGDSATLTRQEDIQLCVEKLLLVSFSDLELLCKHCHAIYSYQQRYGVSELEAKVSIALAPFKKLSAAEQVYELRKAVGTAADTAVNEKQRVHLYKQHLEKELSK